MKKIIFTILLNLGIITTLWAQTSLTPGDVAIIGYNYDNPDQLKIVSLVNISVGTVVNFTDNGWTGTALQTGEGTFVWNVTSAIAAGSIITLNTSGMNLSTSGDQVLVYQGSSASPSFVYGISTTTWRTSGSITSTTSYRPAALTNGLYARDFSVEMDNGNYNVASNNGNKSTILTNIGNSANWTLNNSRLSTWPAWSFTLSNMAVEPTSQATSLQFTNILSWKYTVGYTAASPAPAGYIVLRRLGSIPSSSPVDGLAYQVGDNIGDAKVAYIGTASSFLQQGIVAGSSYHYAVFTYNGAGANTNYRQTAPLTGSVTTLASTEGTYYANINTAAATFVSDLQTRVRSPYTKVSYDNFDETNVTNVAFRDTILGKKVVTCVYSGENYTYTPPMAWIPTTTFSREHTWCHSWMPSYPSESPNEYADQHHLFPVNQNSANAVRSNHPLGEVVTVISSYLEGKYGYDVNGHNVYEPRNAHKGDAARALLYMSLRYDGLNGYNWTFDNLNNVKLPALNEDPQDVAVLLAWHQNDPPDSYEIARNDYIQSIQQNRNPFIDHPEYSDFINWGNLTYNSGSKAADIIAEISTAEPDVISYPNPFNDRLFISAFMSAQGIINLDVFDLSGRLIQRNQWEAFEGKNEWELQTSTWEKGLYILRLTNGQYRKVIKVFK